MTQEQLESLLGRPLTPTEVTNLELYLDIAYETLEELICTTIEPVTETRTFDLREGYSTAFIDIFRSVTAVKVDGTTIDPSDYSIRQWNKRSATWYNSLVFDNPFRSYQKEIEVTASWGFEFSPSYAVPSDLQVILASLFDQITKKNKYDPTVQSKRVEDFQITFRVDADLDEEFYNKYRKTISKYSLCDIPNVQHGDIDCGC